MSQTHHFLAIDFGAESGRGMGVTLADGKVSLEYLPMGKMAGGQDSSGIMSLTLAAERLTPGEKALLRVRAPQTGSQRWFGLYHCP